MNKAKEGLVQQKNQSLWDKQPASKCFVLICCPPTVQSIMPIFPESTKTALLKYEIYFYHYS